MKKILTVVGARPQFVKAAVLSRCLARSPKIREAMLHTGQHFDDAMSAIFFDELGIPAPAHHLGIHGGTHAEMTGRMMEGIEDVLLGAKPDALLVYGDTNSTLAGALAAVKLNIPVIHVEAGLRSYNRRMPEEINRVLTDHASSLLLCPTEAAIGNLAREGIAQNVFHTGDVMYDATLHAQSLAQAKSSILETLKLAPKQYAAATVHRQENTDDAAALARVFEYLGEEAKRAPVVLPLHPRTEKMLARHHLALPEAIRVLPPLGYLDMQRLLSGAQMIYTDSGGVQKEAYFHGVPCVTLRDETEWVETVAHGWNRLWNEKEYRSRSAIADYGDGKAGEACVARIEAFLS